MSLTQSDNVSYLPWLKRPRMVAHGPNIHVPNVRGPNARSPSQSGVMAMECWGHNNVIKLLKNTFRNEPNGESYMDVRNSQMVSNNRRGYTIGDGWGCIPPTSRTPKKIAALQPVCRSLVVSNAISQINASIR